MLQLILHGIGDYFLQTDKQALGKKLPGWYGLKCCLIHCTTYSLPFLFIGSWKAVLVIFTTHFIIDRTNIVAWAPHLVKLVPNDEAIDILLATKKHE